MIRAMVLRALRFALAASVSAAVLTGAPPTSVLAAARQPLVVRETGVSTKHLGHMNTEASWGAVLVNPSRTHDAIRIGVTVTLLGATGKPIPVQGVVVDGTLPLIPAGQMFYLGGNSNLRGDVQVRGVRVDLTIGATIPKRYGLPTVSNPHVGTNGQISVTITNPYATSIRPYDYTADAVLFDQRGRVIGGFDLGQIGNFIHESSIRPRGQVPLSFFTLGAVSAARIASARVSVFPA